MLALVGAMRPARTLPDDRSRTVILSLPPSSAASVVEVAGLMVVPLAL